MRGSSFFAECVLAHDHPLRRRSPELHIPHGIPGLCGLAADGGEIAIARVQVAGVSHFPSLKLNRWAYPGSDPSLFLSVAAGGDMQGSTPLRWSQVPPVICAVHFVRAGHPAQSSGVMRGIMAPS